MYIWDWIFAALCGTTDNAVVVHNHQAPQDYHPRVASDQPLPQEELLPRSEDQKVLPDEPLLPVINQFVAFGDWGCHWSDGPKGADLINEYLRPIEATSAVFLLGDNFYPKGIDPELGCEDPQFDLFSQHLSKDIATPFYITLGNHDVQRGAASWQSQFDYPLVKNVPNWILPSKNHFLRNRGNDVCVWFIDTAFAGVGDDTHLWLRASLAENQATCTWRIFSTHYPMLSDGVYKNDKKHIPLIHAALGPYINEFAIHVYLSGHDHTTQVIRDHNQFPNCIIAIIGGICDINPRSFDAEKPERLVFGNDRNQPLIADIKVDDTALTLSIVRLVENRPHFTLHTESISN